MMENDDVDLDYLSWIIEREQEKLEEVGYLEDGE